MDTIDAINAIIADSGYTSRQVSNLMGKSDSYISAATAQSKRKSGGVNSGTLASVADACGYSLALVPKGSVPDDAITIDPPDRGNGDV